MNLDAETVERLERMRDVADRQRFEDHLNILLSVLRQG